MKLSDISNDKLLSMRKIFFASLEDVCQSYHHFKENPDWDEGICGRDAYEVYLDLRQNLFVDFLELVLDLIGKVSRMNGKLYVRKLK